MSPGFVQSSTLSAAAKFGVWGWGRRAQPVCTAGSRPENGGTGESSAGGAGSPQWFNKGQPESDCSPGKATERIGGAPASYTQGIDGVSCGKCVFMLICLFKWRIHNWYWYPALYSVCRATRHQCLRAPTPHLNGQWMTSPILLIITLSSMSSTRTLPCTN